MSYAIDITAPALTLVTAPVRETLIIARSILTRGTITFPKGHAGLTGVWIEYQGKQVLPQNVEFVYRGDNVEIELYPKLRIDEPPYFLEILMFNEDDTYDHTARLTFDTDPLPDSDSGGGIIGAITDFFGGG